MLKEKLEELFEFIAHHIPSDQIMLAKKEYQKTTGETYEDDKSYNSRMSLFLEWYLLDNYKPGNDITTLERITEDNLSVWSQEQIDICKDWSLDRALAHATGYREPFPIDVFRANFTSRVGVKVS